MTEERRIQFATEVDTTGTQRGFDQVERQAQEMATTVTRSGQQAERAVSGIGNGAGAAATRVQAAERSLIQSIQRTTAQMEAGSRASAQYYEVLARQRGVDPASLTPYLNQLRAIEQAQRGAAQSATQTANALRQVPAQLTDIVTSLQGGQAPLTVLLQQGGQLRDSFGGIGAAARGLATQLMALVNPYTVAAVAAGGLAFAYTKGAAEARAYNTAIAVTGNIAGTSAAQLADAAREVSAFVGSQKEAAGVIASLISTGRVSGENVTQLTLAATRAQKDLGREVATTVEEFAALGKAPSAALADLSGKYRDITSATYSQVRALEEQGRVTEAATIAQQAHAESIERQRQRVLDGLSDWERGWTRIKDMIGKTTDAVSDYVLGIGRAETAQQKINALLSQRDNLESNLSLAQQRGDSYLVRRTQAALDANKAEINAARARADADKERAAEQAKVAAREAESIRIRSQAVALLSREKQREEELAAVRRRSAELDLSAKDTETALALVRKKYSDVDEEAKRKREEGSKRALDQLKKEQAAIAEMAGLTSTFAEDWSQLSALYAKGAVSLDQLTAAQAKLLAQQPAIKEANEKEVEARKKLAESDQLMERGLETARQYRDSLLGQVGVQKQNNEQIGLSVEASAELEVARLNNAAALKEESAAALAALDAESPMVQVYREQAQALRDLASAKSEGARKQIAVDSAKAAQEEWKRAAASIEQSLTDALLRGFESGKSFGKNLADTLKNMFSTLVLRPIVSAVVSPVAGALTSALGLAGTASAATGGAGEGGIVSNAGSVLGGISALSGSFGSGLMSGLSAWGAEGSVMGLLNSGALFGGGIVNGLGAIVGALGPIALGIGVATSLFKSAFGRGPKEIQSTTLNGSFGDGGFSGTIDQAWKREGGFFRSDKRGVDITAVDQAMAKQLGSAYDALKLASADFASVLGINADSLKTRTQSLSIALGKDEEANKKAIADFFIGVGDTIAKELLPTVSQFAKEGEGASATFERIATGYATIDAALESIGRVFGQVGVGSISARERLIDLSGGIQTFAQNTAGFQQNFLTEAERNAPVLKRVTAELAAMGLSAVDTREEFKAVVLGLDLTTEAGAKQYGALMKLQAAFAQVYPAIDRATIAAEQRKGLQDEYDQLTMTSAQLLARQRDALDESNRALFDSIQAIKAQAAAAQAVKDQAATLLGNVDSSFSVLQRLVGKERELIQGRVSNLRSLSDALRSTFDSIRSPEQVAADRESAKAEVSAALAIARAGGPLPDAEKLRKALADISKGAGPEMFATFQDYQRELLGTQGDLKALADLSDSQLSVEEQALKQYDAMLEKYQEQIDVLKGISTTGLTIQQAIEALSAALLQAQANPVVSATAAINDAYKSSLGRAPDAAGLEYWQNQAAGGAPLSDILGAIKGSPEAQVQKLYKDVFGRAADAGGLNFWLDSISKGVSLADVRKALEQSEEAKKKLRGFAVGTNRVPYDMPAFVHQDERIIPAADNRELMRRLASPSENSAALAAAVDRLTREVEGLRAETRATATHTEKTARYLGRVVREDAIVTTTES
jgi:phage-related minor tail protein